VRRRPLTSAPTGRARCRRPFSGGPAQTTFWVHVPHGQPAEVWLRLEDGTFRTGIRQVDNFTGPFDLDGRLIGEASFVLPDDLPLGYHRVHLRSETHEASAALIVTPGWLGLPERLGARRTWGLATQLYSVRSRQSWGVGDLTDLVDLAVWSASVHGAGMSWSIRCTRPPRPHRWSRRRICRRHAGSSTRCICELRPFPEFAQLRKRGRVRGCGTVSRSTPRRWTRSTATPRGRPSGLPWNWCSPSRGRQAASWRTRRSALARVPRSTTSRPGVRWPMSTAATGTSGPIGAASRR
jgi:hypothetical protein